MQSTQSHLCPCPHPYQGKYVVIRTYSAGVHVGILKEYDATTRHAYLLNSRRLWKWEGAFTLSEISLNGIKGGRLSVILPEILIGDVIEIICCSWDAEKNLREFPVYQP